MEQEVTGDDTLALQSVLESDEKRESLLKEEKDINDKMNSGRWEESDFTALEFYLVLFNESNCLKVQTLQH